MPQRLSRALLLLVMMVAICAPGAASSAQAQPLPSDRVYVRFDAAVRVPGAALPPGDYLLVLGMPVAGQAMLDIYRAKDAARVVSCLVIESRLPRPANVTMLEYAGVTPPALRAWFHPGNAVGFEFVYSAPEAKSIYLASGEPVPFASFTAIRRDLVGTFAVAVSGSPAAGAPPPIGTSGTLPRPVRSLDARDHLEASRGALAERLGAVDDRTRPRIVLLIELLERLEAAHRGGRTREIREELALTVNTLGSILPVNDSRFAGVPPVDAETRAALERVRAHLTAFETFIR